MYQEKPVAELEAQLRAKEVELEVLKANQKSLKGEVKASTTSSRTTETKELDKLKEAKRALENDIDGITPPRYLESSASFKILSVIGYSDLCDI
ncbi:unnamed protein product [Tilletia laevis]|uniref:Uncharacterized protein n=1 Tax=Tilletia laevis TaxID=157183 RepID=A0A9N8MA04_9BASI|nr:unnamed protein product [Tilletia laevis]CAD6963043.1 unnamed protein product [Tilletia caries]CAD6964895.1 unnamed protein product [Tilletia laevis]